MSAKSMESDPSAKESLLNGRVMPGLGITERDGVRLIRWPSGFIEFDYHQVIESEVHPDKPSIGIVRAHHIPKDVDSRSATLELVKSDDNPPMLFLFSKYREMVLITSRMGKRDGEGMVTVRPPKYDHEVALYDGPIRHVEMFDAPSSVSEEDLIELHENRDFFWRRENLSWLEQSDVDELFFYMSND